MPSGNTRFPGTNGRRCLTLRAGSFISLFALFLTCLAPLQAEPKVLHREVVREPVTDGVELIRIRQFDTRGWLNISALEIDHTKPHLELDALLGKNRITGAQPLSKTVNERGAVGAINGDFFHIQTSQAPIGAHVQSGELVKSPPAGPRALVAGAQGETGTRPFIGALSFRGSVTNSAGAKHPIDGWNPPAVSSDGIAFYNHRWAPDAPGPQSLHMSGWPSLVHAILDADQRVIRMLKGKPGPTVPEDGSVLLGRGHGAAWLLAHAQPGETLEIDHRIVPENITAGIGGFPVLIENGEIVVGPDERDVHPRSAFGYNHDKTRSWFVAVEGRSVLSRGVNLHELAAILKNFGAHHALNLDGGGSTALLARPPGKGKALLQNMASDGQERPVPNGLGIFNTAPIGPMKKLFLKQPSPRDEYTIEPGELRVAPGTNFRPTAFATDEHLNAVELPAPVDWNVTPKELGSFTSGDRFQPGQAGRGKITASVSVNGDTFEASQPIRVLGEPVRLEVTPAEIVLNPEEKIELGVNAVDARGFAAPVPIKDVAWEVRGEVGEIHQGRLVAAGEPGSGAVRASFRDLRGIATVGIGARPVLLAKFDADSSWWTNSVPEAVKTEISHADHPPFIREHPSTTKLTYDFTGTTRTRAAYLYPEGDALDLPGRPLQLGLWVYGDGREAWLRGQLIDAGGTARTIDFARNVDWTGWRYLETEIPPGMDYPISLRRIYVVETRPDVQYSGAIYLDEILAVHAPEIDSEFLPNEPKVHDPANKPVETDETSDETFRFIVFGDSKVVADAPDSSEARVLSALIEKINEQDAEFALFTGDLIEHDTEENYRVGKALLDRLRMPYYTTVANHEIAGTDSYDRFRDWFGPTYFDFSHGNSDFLVLNSARPGLRVSEAKQWPWMRERLAQSTADNLFILTHTTVIDPMPGGDTGWSDESEISLFQRLLTDEVEKDRNVYVFHGHVHGFDRRVFDGVQYLTSAGAGSSLYLPPDKGGFFHYTVVTVKGDKVSYQVIPLLERIELTETFEATAGETVALNPFGIAPDELVRFPLRYPAAVKWTVANPKVARITGATGELHALQSGETEISVTSGGVTASAHVKVR